MADAPATPIYLDHNATAPLSPAAAAAMQAAWADGFANPASQHAAGRVARRIVESGRERLLELVGGEASGRTPDRLVFTSGGTESNALALHGLLAASGRRRLVVSAIEHPSVAATADRLAAAGFQVDRLGVDERGVVRLTDLDDLLSRHADDIGLVSVLLGSNETGVVQPIAEMAERCRRSGVLSHTDAVQAIGKTDLAFRSLGVDAMTFTAHKFHGPCGLGALVLRPNVPITPQLSGGHQQADLRPGTEPAPLVAGAVAALDEASTEGAARFGRLARLRDRLQAGLVATWPDAVVVGGDAPRLPHTLALALPGADRQALVMAYDLAGVAAGTGSACASGSSEPSPTLVAMGLPAAVIDGAVRFGVGAFTTEQEIDLAIERIGHVHADARKRLGKN